MAHPRHLPGRKAVQRACSRLRPGGRFGRTPTLPSARRDLRAPGPSAACRSRCREWERRPRRCPDRRRARPPRTRTRVHRRGRPHGRDGGRPHQGRSSRARAPNTRGTHESGARSAERTGPRDRRRGPAAPPAPSRAPATGRPRRSRAPPRRRNARASWVGARPLTGRDGSSETPSSSRHGADGSRADQPRTCGRIGSGCASRRSSPCRSSPWPA